MKGAGKYAVPMFSCYEQVGLEKIYDKSIRDYIYYDDHVVFDFGKHARGYTLNIYLINSKEQLEHNGLRNCENVCVYGIISGQPGWTESYGWIIKGKWCDHINDILQSLPILYKQMCEKAEQLKEQKAREEREKVEKIASSYEKYFS